MHQIKVPLAIWICIDGYRPMTTCIKLIIQLHNSYMQLFGRFPPEFNNLADKHCMAKQHCHNDTWLWGVSGHCHGTGKGVATMKECG